VCLVPPLPLRLSENAHLPFDMLTALSEAEGLRYSHPSSLRRTSTYASFLAISKALHLDIFRQPRRWFFDSLVSAAEAETPPCSLSP
jgi:hypothetical protein